MGGKTKAPPRGATIGLSPSNLALTVAFYDAVFGAIGVSPVDEDDCRAWGDMLLVRRVPLDSPTTGADVFLEARAEAEIDAVVNALKDAGFSLSFDSGSSGEHRMAWVTFPDPDGNRVWVTVTA